MLLYEPNGGIMAGTEPILLPSAPKTGNIFFGEIKNGEMMLSPLGAIVYVLWHEIPNRIKHVELGDFVVMPNHIYGILIIDEPFIKNNDIIVESGHALIPQQPGKNRFQNIGENTISSIVGGYKSAVTKFANRLELKNGWQSRFNDHIIRDDAEYQRISNYIINNPMKWTADKFSFNK